MEIFLRKAKFGMKIYRYTEFKSNPFGHGAEKRTAQISEILREAGYDFEIIKRNDINKINPSRIILKSLSHFIFIQKILNFNTFKNLRIILRFVYRSIITEVFFSKIFNENNKLLIWEFTRSDCFFIPGLARKMKLYTIGIPHNIESLVPNQCSSISGKKSPDWFNEEIKYLSFCDLVFCISKEDTNLLSLFGINAFYLPYYPVLEVERALFKIRKKRTEKINENKRRKILMLGSADNQPTRLGMIDRISFFNRSKGIDFKILIAGFNTEILSELVEESSEIRILGTLNSEELDSLLIEVDYILIHQPPTSGSLTRIPEMLIAGLPVILNFTSARNYFNMDGIYTYNCDEELLELLKSDLKKIPDLPVKPEKEVKIFKQKIRSINLC